MEDLVMKKLLAMVLTLTMVLSFSAVAFAEVSPIKKWGVSDLPSESEAVADATVVTNVPATTTTHTTTNSANNDAKIVSLKDMTAEQKAEMDEALNKVKEDGSLATDALSVETSGESTVTIALDEDAVVYVIYPDGTIVKLIAKDLNKNSEGKYEITVNGSCEIVIAKKAA